MHPPHRSPAGQRVLLAAQPPQSLAANARTVLSVALLLAALPAAAFGDAFKRIDGGAFDPEAGPIHYALEPQGSEDVVLVEVTYRIDCIFNHRLSPLEHGTVVVGILPACELA